LDFCLQNAYPWKKGSHNDFLHETVIACIIGGVVGARLLSVFALHQGGMAYYGGLAGGALALGESIARLGCDVYGYASAQAPFPRILNGILYHNIPLYTSLATFKVI